METNNIDIRWTNDGRGNWMGQVGSPDYPTTAAKVIRSYSRAGDRAWVVHYHAGRGWAVVRGCTTDIDRAFEVAAQRVLAASKGARA